MIKERLAALRERMQEKKIDVYMIPTEDFHASEYVGDYFKVRRYYLSFSRTCTCICPEKLINT